MRRLANTLQTIDISNKPEVLALVDDIVSSGVPRVLRASGSRVVLITPYATSKTDAQRQALERAGGSWTAEEAEALKQKVRESRAVPPEPAVEL